MFQIEIPILLFLNNEKIRIFPVKMLTLFSSFSGLFYSHNKKIRALRLLRCFPDFAEFLVLKNGKKMEICVLHEVTSCDIS